MNHLSTFYKVVILGVSLVLSVCCSAEAASVTYTYDGLNRLIRANYNGVVVFEYLYDAAGNMTKKKVHNSNIMGDLNGDGDVALADAILALQVITGKRLPIQIDNSSDVNGDARIGVDEAVYILNIIR